MKRVLLFLGSVLGLLFITIISLEFLGFYDINFTIETNQPMWMILLIVFGISIGGPCAFLLTFHLVRIIGGFFKPKFVRIADNLERAVKRNNSINYKLNVPQKKEMMVNKMQHIWSKADMQYPLSELDFEKIQGGNPSA